MSSSPKAPHSHMDTMARRSTTIPNSVGRAYLLHTTKRMHSFPYLKTAGPRVSAASRHPRWGSMAMWALAHRLRTALHPHTASISRLSGAQASWRATMTRSPPRRGSLTSTATCPKSRSSCALCRSAPVRVNRARGASKKRLVHWPSSASARAREIAQPQPGPVHRQALARTMRLNKSCCRRRRRGRRQSSHMFL